MRSGQVPAQKSCGALDATFKNNKAEIDDRVDSNATRFKVEGAGVQEHPDNNIQHNKSKKQAATTNGTQIKESKFKDLSSYSSELYSCVVILCTITAYALDSLLILPLHMAKCSGPISMVKFTVRQLCRHCCCFMTPKNVP